jgi:hypothetical protein
MPVMTFTLDTSAVIAGAHSEPDGDYVDRLAEMGRSGAIRLAVTSGFDVDQAGATTERRRRNLEYLSQVSTLEVAPGLARLSGDPDPDKPGRVPQWPFFDRPLLAGPDEERMDFVTKDDDDIVKKRGRLKSDAGIEVVSLAEAVHVAAAPIETA